jgi:hypothetical protein
MMSRKYFPPSDLAQLQKEVLDRPPVSALPSNLPDHWLDLIARDLEEVMGPNAQVGEAAGVYASSPLALVLRILEGKSLGPTLSISCGMLWDFLFGYG